MRPIFIGVSGGSGRSGKEFAKNYFILTKNIELGEIVLNKK